MKIIATSDLHLGQTGADGLGQYSLLSKRAPMNLVYRFVREAAAFVGADPVTLLFAGDVLDLSLAYAADALEDLRDLIGRFVGVVPIGEIVYVIGNHDHHLWSLHSEDKRLLAPLRAGLVPAVEPEPELGSATRVNATNLARAYDAESGHGALDPRLKAMYQVTPPGGEPFAILQPLVDRIFAEPAPNFGLPSPKITIAYPSYERELAPGTRLYVTHGHLFGGLYSEISDLLAPMLFGRPHDRVAATVNHPLIELIYWSLGETGEGIGADGLVEQIYTDLQKGRDGRLRPIVKNLVDQVLPHGVLWRVIGSLERSIIVDSIMDVLGKQLESPPLKSVTAADRHADVAATREKLVEWLRACALPTHLTVLYGHTHVRDDYELPDARGHSYNLGTWLVEPNHDAPKTGFLGIDGANARWVDVA